MKYIIQSIKADFYRLSRSKGTYITLAIFIIFTIFMVTSQSVGNVGVVDESTLNEFKIELWTADKALEAALYQSMFIVYFSIPFTVILMGTDYKNKTYRNIITVGISRTQYFIGKVISLALTTAFITLLYCLVTVVSAGILNGWGDVFSFNFFSSIIGIIGLRYFFCFASLMLGVAALYMTRSNIAMTLGIVLIPMILQLVLYFANPGITFFSYFDIQSALSSVGIVSTQEILPYVGAACLLVTVLSSLSLTLFNQSDL